MQAKKEEKEEEKVKKIYLSTSHSVAVTLKPVLFGFPCVASVLSFHEKGWRAKAELVCRIKDSLPPKMFGSPRAESWCLHPLPSNPPPPPPSQFSYRPSCSLGLAVILRIPAPSAAWNPWDSLTPHHPGQDVCSQHPAEPTYSTLKNFWAILGQLPGSEKVFCSARSRAWAMGPRANYIISWSLSFLISKMG